MTPVPTLPRTATRRDCNATRALLACVLLGLCFGCSAQEPASASDPTKPDATAGAKPLTPPTEAERIAQAERLLDEARKDLAETKKSLEDPMSDYARAEKKFKALDAKVAQQKKAIAKLREAKKLDEAAKADAEMKPLAAEWEQARDRFNAAIAQHKALQEKKVALAAQIAKLEQSVAGLKQPEAPPTGKAGPPPPPATAGTDPAPKAPDAKGPTPLGVPGVPAPAATPTAPAKAPVPDDAEIRAARNFADGRRAALTEAEDKAKSVEDRVRVLEQLIATEQRLLAAERKVADEAEKELRQLTEQLPKATPAETPTLLARTARAQKRLGEARDRIAALTDRIASLNDDLRSEQGERIEALQKIEATKKESEDADRELTRLQNPLAVRNINKWLAAHGLNMILIVVGVVSLHLVVRLSSRQIVRLVARNSNRGSDEDRENRANTLVGVFRYATNLVIYGGGVVVLLDEAGIPVVPLMGGAAVLGLAVAFGAQNLIKDYFSGFMMLLEDQYGVNDVVRIGSLAGLVEKITLRVTVLRDLEGVLHFIPHGQVTAVSNMTHGWSRAQFDIPVPHDADVDRIMGELVKLGRELRADPAFGPKIVEDPEMLGVETLDATAVGIRFLVKTRPLQQWAVKRELLRRIKLRLDELGVGLPPPRQRLDMVLPFNKDGGNGQDDRPHRLWPPTEAKTGT